MAAARAAAAAAEAEERARTRGGGGAGAEDPEGTWQARARRGVLCWEGGTDPGLALLETTDYDGGGVLRTALASLELRLLAKAHGQAGQPPTPAGQGRQQQQQQQPAQQQPAQQHALQRQAPQQGRRGGGRSGLQLAQLHDDELGGGWLSGWAAFWLGG
jgi:hypothetical protein